MEETVYSFVVPVLNEAESIFPLVSEINRVMVPFGNKYEIIFIDDGSTDDTLIEILKLKENDFRIKHVAFLKNKGKSAAYAQGFSMAKGEQIITLDGDLQDKPSEIFILLPYLKYYDLVIGWRKYRKDSNVKKISSRIWNLSIRILFGFDFKDSNSGFRVMNRDLAVNLNLYKGFYRFIPIIACKKGYRVIEIPIRHGVRKYGKSKYGFERIFTGLRDLFKLKFFKNNY